MDALKNASHRKDYAPVKGLSELCEKAANFHSQVDGHTISPEQILVAPGSKILIYNTMLAFEKCTVFIPAPAWVSYAPQATLMNHAIVKLETSFESLWRVSAEQLDKALSSSQTSDNVLILNYPGNPEGLTYSEEELQSIISVARKHGLWIIADEIYGLLHHKGKHTSLAKLYPERTLVTTGLSKWCGAGGWRLGIQILPANIPDDFREALLGIASETYSCAPTPVQVAACEAYSFTSDLESYLTKQRTILSIIGNKIASILNAAGARVHSPQGGFYLLVDFSPIHDSLPNESRKDTIVCETIMQETGVALLPGSAFGMDSQALTARLAYVDMDGAALMKQSDITEQHVLGQCSHMMEGIEKLADWIKSKG